MTKTDLREAGTRWNRAAEAVLLFIGLPIAMAALMPPVFVLPILVLVSVLGAVLLHVTPGFSWAELAEGWRNPDWRFILIVSVVTSFVTAGLVLWLVPGQALILPRYMPGLWLMILLLYPVISALPQELLFRPLFYKRYGGLFASEKQAVLANACAFSLAHLMYWNPVAMVLTFAGGLIFSKAYLRCGGFPTAVLLHGICGGIIFTSGLGTFFYHGDVPVTP